jgi:hypothetical protein
MNATFIIKDGDERHIHHYPLGRLRWLCPARVSEMRFAALFS